MIIEYVDDSKPHFDNKIFYEIDKHFHIGLVKLQPYKFLYDLIMRIARLKLYGLPKNANYYNCQREVVNEINQKDDVVGIDLKFFKIVDTVVSRYNNAIDNVNFDGISPQEERTIRKALEDDKNFDWYKLLKDIENEKSI